MFEGPSATLAASYLDIATDAQSSFASIAGSLSSLKVIAAGIFPGNIAANQHFLGRVFNVQYFLGELGLPIFPTVIQKGRNE